MEKTEEIKQEVNATNAAEPQQQDVQQQDVQQENGSAANAEQKPQKKNHVVRVIIFLVVAAALGVSAWHFFKSRHEDDYDYGYEYGDEPSYGYVSYSNGVSNIVNPDSREVIV